MANISICSSSEFADVPYIHFMICPHISTLTEGYPAFHDSQDKHDLVLKISFEKAPTDVSPAILLTVFNGLNMGWPPNGIFLLLSKR